MGREDLTYGKDVLLFFRSRDPDTFVAGDHRLRQWVRESTISLRSRLWPHKQQVVGYEVSFDALCKALRDAGMAVHVNNYRLALKNPSYPIGVSGFPEILDDWKLPNPAVIGPGLYVHPKCKPTLLNDPRFATYLLKGDWMRQMFEPYYGKGRVHTFFTGIDLKEWPDTRSNPKQFDFLIYDKIRWNRDRIVPGLLEKIVKELEFRNFHFKILRYGNYNKSEYRQYLADSAAMIFLCEHETQGMAWQEALACNLPIIAWDQGFWLDPARSVYESEPVPATSVPGFSETCGERFEDASEFSAALDRFLERRFSYEPRKWIAMNRSPAMSAARYLEFYWKAGADDRQS